MCSIFWFPLWLYGSRSSRSTAGPLTVVSKKIFEAFNRSGSTRSLALNIFLKGLACWSSSEIQVGYLELFCLFSVTQGFVWFWSSSRIYSWSYNFLPNDVISNIAIYADDSALYSNCDQASDLWEQLNLASEF